MKSTFRRDDQKQSVGANMSMISKATTSSISSASPMTTSISDVPMTTVSNTTTFSASKSIPTSTNLPKRSFVTSSEESSEGDLTPTPGDDSKMRSPIHTTDEEAVLAVLETGKYASKKNVKIQMMILKRRIIMRFLWMLQWMKQSMMLPNQRMKNSHRNFKYRFFIEEM